MDIQASLNDEIKQFEDLKRRILELNQQIGALQEEGRALHLAAVEKRGAITALEKLLAPKKEEPALILPEKKIVAPDGKTVVGEAKAEEKKDAPAAEAKPVTQLEVK